MVILPGLNGRLMGDHQVMDGGDFSETMVISMGISRSVKATNMGLTKHPGGAYVLGADILN